MTATKSQIQFVRSLQSRKTRDELGLFVGEGPKVVAELLAAKNLQVQDVFATPAWAEAHAETIHRAGGALVEINDQTLSRMSSLSSPNQVIAVFTKPRFENPTPMDHGFSLLIDGVQDPGNLGTILRCADWFDVHSVICGPGCADAFNAKVIQSTMGSIARVPVTYESNLEQLLEQATAHLDFPIIAATLDGTSVYETPPTERGILIIGNESRGIRPELLSLASHHVTIPRRGHAESLNAAMATGILLSHLRRG